MCVSETIMIVILYLVSVCVCVCVCVHVSLSVPITVCLSLDYLQTTVCKLIINRNDNDEWLVKFVISGMQ